ncbi:MAG: VOC family protein, partial [Gemmatimonadota bacterium]|nr:VOC family protein [Gemmatimonadota bacterium]
MNATRAIPGIHHVTAIAGDPGRALAFYTETLGLRLVKRTVNHDDPGTWHLYFADAAATPGCVLTLFPHPGARPARAGTGMVEATRLAVPSDALGWWEARLREAGAGVAGVAARPGGERALAFRDPDGLALELVATDSPPRGEPWTEGPVPAERAIGGIHSVVLALAHPEPTARFLAGTMGVEREGGLVDLVARPGKPPGRIAAGAVHHVAWRAGDAGAHAAWRDRIAAAGRRPTPVVDRFYFRSFYFREPGGVQFEFSTE